MNQRLTDIRRAQLDQLLSGGTNMAGGGSVSQPAAQIDGNDFVEAAKAYGLNTDNATLNKIVARVNKGESVREAARNVAQSHAGGGLLKKVMKTAVKAAEAAPQAEALRLAQQRAALPPAKGGLGLAANNTPEQRAAAMGFNKDTYHGTFRDIKKLDPGVGSTESHAGKGVYSTDSPEDASRNYASIYGPDVSSGVERGMEERDKDFRKIYGRMKDENLTPRQQEIILQNAIGADNLGVVYPLKIRSNKSIHLDAPEKDPVTIGPFEHYDEANDVYTDTPHTAKFREALDEFSGLGGETDPIYEAAQDYLGESMPARDLFNAVKKSGSESGLYDPFTGDIVSGGVAAGDFIKNFGVDEIRHTPQFGNRELNIGKEHTISLDPDNVRSRFAAFDPFRKTAAIAATMGVAAPNLLAKDKKEKKKAQGGLVHLAGGGDPRKRGLFPKMSMQAIVDSPGFDPTVPDAFGNAYQRRISEKEKYERETKDQKLTPANRVVAGLEAAGMIGSALFEGVQQFPKLIDGEEAYNKAVGERMYQPRFQPEKAAEYVGNVGNFLERLETEYKIPQIVPELIPFIGAAEAAKQQSKRAVKQGALTAASRMDAGPAAGSMAAQRGAVKLGGGNWVDTEVKRSLSKLKQDDSYAESFVKSVKEDLAGYEGQPQYADDVDIMRRDLAHMEQTNAFNKWVDTKAGSYVRNQMATPDDPVVKMLDVRAAKIEADYQAGQKRLAKLDERIAQAPANTTEEQNTLANLKRTRSQRAAEIESDRELAMDSMLPGGRDYGGYDYLRRQDKENIEDLRKSAGFPIEGFGQSRPAKAWESAQDAVIQVRPAENYQNQAEKIAAARDAEKAYTQYMNVELPERFKEFINKQNMSETDKQALIKKTPKNQMKELMGGDDKYEEVVNNLWQARNKANSGTALFAEENPYLAKLPPETPVYNASYLPDLGIDHILDVLKDDVATGKLKLEDLNKITMDQAVKRAAEYDFEMAKKARDAVAQSRATMPVYKEYPEGYKWVQLTKPGDFNAESNSMGHSVRGYEPEKGDPDWTPESGDSGRPDYGHGGWEAIKSGKAKVYSLVDPSGRPHTTIEVKSEVPSRFIDLPEDIYEELNDIAYTQIRQIDDPKIWDKSGSLTYTGQDELDKLRDKAMQDWAKQNYDKLPQTITQIKGKGNARPAEKYDPYTQDFVRSGKWSDVNRNDLRNTGLIEHSGKYFTEPEFVEAAKKYGRMGVHNTTWETSKQRHIDAGVPEEEALLNWVEAFKDGRGTLDIPDEPNMAGGGLLSKIGKAAKAAEKVMPTARIGLEAPGIIIPSKVSNVKEAVRQSKGEYGARRVERAADEIPNLEKLYKEEALRRAFVGDNAAAMMTMKPEDFEKYAIPLQPRFMDKNSTRFTTSGERLDYPEYMNEYLPNVGAFNDVPFLMINKEEQGLPLTPFISGHEGRHRNRVMAGKGEQAGLVQLLPRAELREPFPRRSQEEYINALKEELKMTDNMVLPERFVDEFSDKTIKRPAIKLPDVYAKGGEVNGLKNALNNLLRTDKPEVHMALGGATNVAKAAAKAAEKAAKAAKVDHPLVFPRAVPKSLEEIRPIAQRMAEQMTGDFVKQNPKVTTNPAGKSRKQFEREKSIPLETRNVVPERAAPDVNYEDYMGYGLVGVPGDPTLGGVAKRGSLEEVAQPTVELTRVGDITPDYPVPLFGGPRYGDDEKFWASNFGAAVPIQKNASKLADEYQSPIIAKYIKMGSGSENFALHNLDALLAIQRPERLDKAKMAQLTEVIQAGSPKYGKFPGFTGFEEPIDVLLQAQMDSNLRKHIAETLTKPTITNELGLPNGLDVVAAITHPELRNLETGASGFSVGKMKPGAKLQRGESSHPTYDTDIPGSFLGRSKYPTPYEIAFPDTTAYARSQMTPGVQEFNMMKLLGPRERIDQQYIDEIKMYEQLMKQYTGKKKGGLAQTKKVKRHGNTVPH